MFACFLPIYQHKPYIFYSLLQEMKHMADSQSLPFFPIFVRFMGFFSFYQSYISESCVKYDFETSNLDNVFDFSLHKILCWISFPLPPSFSRLLNIISFTRNVVIINICILLHIVICSCFVFE